MIAKYLPAERANRMLLIATMLLIIWTAIELQFTKIWAGFLPSIVRMGISYTGELLLIIMAFIVVIHPTIGRKNLLQKLKNPLNFSLLLFFSFALFSMFINNVPFAQGIFGLRAIFQYLILFYILLAIEIPTEWVKKVFYLILGIGIVQSIIGFLQIAFLVPLPLRNIEERRSIEIGEEVRAFGMMDSSNTLAGFLVAVLLLVLLYVFVYKGNLSTKSKMIYLIIGAVILTAIALTFSRQAFLALIGCLGLIGIIFRKNKAFRILLVSSAALVVVFVVGYAAALFFLDGFAQRNLYTLDLSKNYRFLIIMSGLDVFLLNPITGVGPGMFGSNAAFVFNSPFHQFLDEGLPSTMRTVDNNALYVIVEYGVIGVLLLGYFLFKVIKTMTVFSEQTDILMEKWVSLFVVTFAIAFVVMGLLSTAWENHQIALWLWLFLGIGVNWYKKGDWQ
ncbi:O-antigen ligase family protein [Alkalihalophilus lindianensis]|uniref:O-antigen ligase family protein n=1 Tax=Alkalihalophilus lindianensis TaxID=1630542 RepID=A0ABU3X8V5_9BACI|nr:O-antigen ligase family protein [Alkalihalophilus lindianensis]MDV2684325.1 O-antigen ligase family protein [Alkalihalophilus lindianensis]